MIEILKNLCYIEKINLIAKIFIFAFIAECTFGSSGRWFEIGPLSIRILLFVACFITTLPAAFSNIKVLSSNFQIIITVCFGVYLMICAAVGLINGNNKGFIWADVSTLMTLALFPGFMSVMCNRKSLKQAIDVVFWTSTVLATIIVIFHIALAFIEPLVISKINHMLNFASLGGLAQMQTGMQRIYMKSQIFFQVAIIYGVWKIITTKSLRIKLLISICIGVLFSGCILSYTRGFWLGLAASVVFVFLFTIKYWKKYVKLATVAFSVFLVLFSLSAAIYKSPVAFVEIVNRFNPNLIVLDGSKNIDMSINELYDDKNDAAIDKSDKNDATIDKSDKNDAAIDKSDKVNNNNLEAVIIRSKTLELSKQKIKQHPIFGNGLGENLDQIRNDGKIEYMYIDMTMKTGIVGTLLFVLTFFGFVIIQVKQSFNIRKSALENTVVEETECRNRFLTAAYLGVAVTSFFNPFLNNPMGIILLILTATAVYDGRQKIKRCEL